MSLQALKEVRSECERFLRKQLPPALQNAFPFSSNDAINAVERSESQWGINPFFLECDVTNERVAFEFNSPTTSFNLYKILRAMQIRKPVLLEGSPGVGKTSLLCAMAKALGRKFFRINLSEQTDMMDLLGADLPVQGAAAGEFAWSDGPLLQAIKLGGWVLLDELNLANQTILEGLNALLDHRSEVFIPELGKTFKCGRGFRIFGSQNPLREGGGRKGLPKSFLNRFTRVYVEQLEIRDMLSISGSLYRNIPSNLIKSMVEFLQDLQVISVNPSSCFLGGPWDFNLRDLLRWCQMVVVHESELWSPKFLASHFADTLFLRRLRCERDHRTVRDLLKTHGFLEKQEHGKGFYVDDKIITVGLLSIDRHKTFSDLRDFSIFVPSMSELMEALAHCISQKLMGILVGPSNAGKTTLVRSFARLNNQELLELSLNAGTDATDLLGGFEQVDLVRRRRILVESIDDLLSSMLFSCSSSAKCDESLYKVGALASRWSRLRADVSTVTKALGTTFLKDAEKIISEIGMGGVDDCLKRAWSDADFLEPIGNLEGKFEWVDSSFTR